MGLHDDLARMEAEDRAATPGPWVDDKRQGGCVVAPAEAHPYIAMQVDQRADAVAIASARTDRPALVEMVRELSQRCMDLSLTIAREISGMGASLDEPWLDRMWAEAKKKMSGR